MEIKIDGKECEQILRDYAFNNFGKLLGCKGYEEMFVEIDCQYSRIDGLKIYKTIPETAEKEG